MKILKTLTLGAAALLMLFPSCSKDNTITEIPTPPQEPDVTAIEQDAAEEYAIANALLHEVMIVGLQEAVKNPTIFGFNHEEIDDRGGCPETKLLPDQGSGDTLRIDFGTGCQLGGDNGPTISGTILCISEGPFNTGANQYLLFKNLSINGYEVAHNSAPGSKGIRFNNTTPSHLPPFEYNFDAFIERGENFTITNPKGEKTIIEALTAPRSFMSIALQDNDPPLLPDFNDFLDAIYSIDIQPLKAYHYPIEGDVGFYTITPVENKPLIYSPLCRWFIGGQLGFWGEIEHTVDYGYDPVLGGDPVEGDGCDGLVKIISPIDAKDCRFVYCP
ncbi:MAG: hypothetical protein AAGG75_21405 [Bacteroidota bacterium]